MKNSHHSLPGAPAALCARLASAARRGFTLVEMLTVIAIIGILGIAIGGALSGSSSSSAALNNAQRSVAGLFQMARMHAVTKGVSTAVIFYKEGNSTDSTDASKYLRYMGIVYKDSAGTWKPLNRGSFLPKGVYFVPPSGNSFGTKGNLPVDSSSKSMSEISVAFPVLNSPTDKWFSYQFKSNGNLDGDNTYILLAPGAVIGPPVNGVPTLDTDVIAAEMAGVAVRKSGGTVAFESFDEQVIKNFEGEN